MATRKCSFVQARACPIDVDEIPLDVCRLCIDAWKTSAEIQTLTGENLLGPTIMVPTTPTQQVFQTTPTPQPTETAPTFTLPTPSVQDTSVDAKDAYTTLKRLDSQFIEDKISADEYVNMRMNLVDDLARKRKADGERPSFLSEATESGMFTPPPDQDDSFHLINLDENMKIINGENHSEKRVLPLLLIERNRGRIGVKKYPQNWKIPGSLTRSNLESIYDLYDQLNADQEKILLQFNGTKLGLLGKKNNRILCMVLERDETIENFTEEIYFLTQLLSKTTSVKEFINKLPQAMNKDLRS